MTNLAHMVHSWRRRQDMTLSEAADRMGIDRGALHRLEKGEPVNQATTFQLWRWMMSERQDVLLKETA